MRRMLENLEPKEVWTYFEDLTRIPRESGNEKEVTDYLISFAKDHDLEWVRDEYLNVLIRKKASPGYENHPIVIMQGHSDMVCEKNQDTIHDFTKDPIKLIIDGDKVTADGTTLGADDGIGVALGLALLSDKEMQHPEIEFLITSDEERGMTGAENFDVSQLKGTILINLDATDEGVFVTGCAGGPAIRTEIPVTREEIMADGVELGIEIRGLKGGHSGEDIHRGRANSIKLLTRILMAIEREVEIQISNVSGGLKYNAIPREAEAIVYVKKEHVKKVESIVFKMGEAFHKEYYLTDKEITVKTLVAKKQSLNTGDKKNPFSKKTMKSVLNYLYFAETGIIRMNMEIKDTVESSVSVGTLHTEKDRVLIETLTRSALESMYMDMYHKIARLAKLVGGDIVLMSNCPEWEDNPNSHIKSVFEKTYKDMYDKNAERWILHAGLECGVFGKKITRQLDMIAVGPDTRNLHTPGEYVSISSVASFWEFLKEAIKRI